MRLSVLSLAVPVLVVAATPAVAADTVTYGFGAGSEITYYVVHPMHHVKGVSKALKGKVTLSADKLSLPLTFSLPLTSFSSGNANRDNNAAFALDVTRYPTATLTVTKFTETKRSVAGKVATVAGTASGRLGLHGLTHPVTIPLTGTIAADGLTVDGEMTIKLTDYGVARPALLGMPIEDDVRVTVHGVAKPL